MENKNLSNAVAFLSPGNGFSIINDVTTESEYNGNVVFSDPSLKPSWSSVQAQIPSEQWGDVRAERYIKLQASDWTVLPDVPMDASKRTEWETYRQALRDVTNQPDPFNVVWPTPPA